MFDASRRGFLGLLGAGLVTTRSRTLPFRRQGLDPDFPVKPQELTLRFQRGQGERRLSFANFRGSSEQWKKTCYEKLADLLGFVPPSACPVRRLRSTEHDGVTIEAWISDGLDLSRNVDTDWNRSRNCA